jgi:hypothetical protein
MLKEPTLVVIYVSPGVAVGGGGFSVTAGGQLRPIPPKQPLIKELTSAAQILAHADNIKNVKIRNELKKMAEEAIVETSRKILSQG